MTGTMPLIMHEFSPATINGVEVWTDLTNRWHSTCTINRGKQYERGQAQAGTMSTAYRNNDGYLTPGYSSSPYNGGVVLYAPIRVRAQYPATANLLDGDLATCGQETSIEPGPLPGYLNIGTDISGATLSIAATGSAFEGGQVFEANMPASAPTGFYILKFLYISLQATSPQARATEYTWSTHVRCTSPGNNPQVSAAIKWLNVSGGVVSSSTGSTVTLTGSATAGWTRVQVTGTPPSGAICGVLAVSTEGTTPASPWTYQQDGSQWEIGTTASAWAEPGDWYYMFGGEVERWPQAWVDDPAGNYTVVQVTASDCLSQLGRQKLNYCYLEYLYQLNPRWLFQLNEQSNGYTPPGNAPQGEITVGGTSMVWADTIGYLNPIYSFSQAWQYATVTPGTQPVSNSPSGGFTGTPGPVVQIQSGFTSNGSGGYVQYSSELYIESNNPASKIGPPQGGTGYSVVLAFNAVQQPGYPAVQFTDPWMWCASNGTTYEGPSSDFVGLAITTAGNVEAIGGPPGTTIYNAASASNGYLDGNWHLACLTVSASGTTLTLMIDAASPVSVGMSSSLASGITFTNESIGAYPGPNAGWYGYLALVSEFEYPLSQAEFSTLYNSWRGSFAGESTGSRIARILDVANFGFPTNIQSGAIGMGAAGDWSSATAGLPFQGQSVLALCQQAVDAEQGQMYAAVDNTFTFTGRTYRSPHPDVRLLTTFGEKADGWLLGDATRSILGSTTLLQGEIPYTLPAKIGYDADQTYTVAQITMYNGLPPVAGTAGSTITIENSTAVNGPLGVQLFSQNMNVFDTNNARSVAQWIVNNGAREDLRVQSLTVDLSGFSPSVAANAWPQVLGTDINTCVAVNRRPMGGAPLSLTQWVEKITWSLDPSKPKATVTYQMSPASKSLG